ncbi:ion channel [Emticicia sp. 17c]|uniref:ion channel n=1 Tax=Emticicia sp. 17c TaxID=3127704 RepID=UPI00301BDAFE
MNPIVRYRREFAEFALLFFMAFFMKWLNDLHTFKPFVLETLVITLAITKTCYFIFENSVQLLKATAHDIAYHRFLLLTTYNIGQMTLSFAIDFFMLYEINKASFAGIDPSFTMFEEMFEFFYFSVLNFTFFGYGDLTPASVAAKIVMLLEVIMAFLTMIFILSDFISMKDSLRKK